MGLPIIGKMLGHTQAATTHRYAHLASDPVKAAAATVAGKIADAMQGTTATPLPGRAIDAGAVEHMAGTSNQLPKEIEWLRNENPVSILAPDPERPTRGHADPHIIKRVETILRDPTLDKLMAIMEKHNRTERTPFLLGPYVLHYTVR